MGTRNMTFVVLGGDIKVAQYCQWDGYPTGQGATILEFFESNPDMKTFAKHLVNAIQPTPEQIRAWYVEAGDDADNDTGFIGMDVADKFKEAHPSLDRDMGAGVLQYILETPIPNLYRDLDFIEDKLFCEWAYCVDLDNNVLEVYSSWDIPSQTEDEGRFGDYPLVAKYPLDALPSKDDFAELENSGE